MILEERARIIGPPNVYFNYMSVLSVRFEVGVSLLLAPARADKRGPKVPFPLVENAGIQPAICKRVSTRPSSGGNRVLLKALLCCNHKC